MAHHDDEVVRSSTRRAPATAAMALRILGALGLCAGAVSLGACGGIAIVDGEGAGGAGGEDATTETVTTTSTTEPKCAPLGEETLETVCLPLEAGAACPPPNESATPFEAALETSDCEGCCYVAEVCGPDPESVMAGECCYSVIVNPNGCGGRPFVVGAEARTARVARRSDWLCEMPCPETGALDGRTRAVLAARFRQAALFEHASVASFARFTLELLGLGAPADLVSATQRAMGDEVRHAQIAFSLASAYAGEAVGPSALAVDGAALGARSAAETAAALAFEGCVHETISALVAAAERDRATEPSVRAALDSLAADEAEHAELAWRALAWLLRSGDEGVLEAARRAFAEPPGFSPVEVGIEGADPAALAAHGYLSAARQQAIAEAAMRDVVLPCARALLASATARAREGAAASV